VRGNFKGIGHRKGMVTAQKIKIRVPNARESCPPDQSTSGPPRRHRHYDTSIVSVKGRHQILKDRCKPKEGVSLLFRITKRSRCYDSEGVPGILRRGIQAGPPNQKTRAGKETGAINPRSEKLWGERRSPTSLPARLGGCSEENPKRVGPPSG